MLGVTDISSARALRGLDPGRKLVCFAALLAACNGASRLRLVRRPDGWDVAAEIDGQWHPFAPLQGTEAESATIGRGARQLARRGVLGWLLGHPASARLQLGGGAELVVRQERSEAREIHWTLAVPVAARDRAATLIDEYAEAYPPGAGSDQAEPGAAADGGGMTAFRDV